MSVSLRIEKINEFTGHNSAIYSLAADIINNVIYSVGGDGWIVKWPLTAEKADGTLIGDTSSKLFSVAYESSHQLLVTGDIDGFLYWIDPTNHKILGKSAFHKGSIFDLCFLSPDNLLSVSGDGYVCLWNTNSRMPKISSRISMQGLRCIKHDKLNQKILIGASDNNIYVLDENTLDVLYVLNNAHKNSIFSLEILNHTFIISGSRDAHLSIWDRNNFMQIKSFSAHWFTINKILLIPEFSAFATASRDKSIRIWDLESMSLLKSIDIQKGGHINSVNSLIWIPDSNFLISCGDDRTIKTFYLQLNK